MKNSIMYNKHIYYVYKNGSLAYKCVDSVTDLAVTYNNSHKFPLHVDVIVRLQK